MPGPVLRRPTPLCWAHRGDSDHCPENTMPAFEAAVAAGADGIELDVTLSADGRLVVIHDATLERTTDGEGPVSAHPWRDLALLDAGNWFDPRFTGTRLPLLEDVLTSLGHKTLVNIEIKPEAPCVQADEPVEAQVVALVRRLHLESQILISSFNFQCLLEVRKRAPELALGVLMEGDEPHLDFPALCTALGAASYHPRVDALTPEIAAACHDAGLAVFTWAYPEYAAETGMRLALTLGADGFFANDPALFLKLRHQG